MASSPSQLSSQVLDRLVAATGRWGNWTIQLDLAYPGRLAPERLQAAADLVQDAEPVLGCRFVAALGRPYWQRLMPAERLCYRRVAGEQEFTRWLRTGIDSRTGPQLRVVHWIHPDGGDRLALAISHAASDAASLVQTCALLADGYRRLAREPDYRLAANLNGSRASWQVLKHIPMRVYPRVAANLLNQMRQRRQRRGSSLIGIPVARGAGKTEQGFVRHTWTAARVEAMKKYGRARQATLNDLLLTSFFRALLQLNGPQPKGRLVATTTANLRRYLPAGQSEAVCNLSSLQDVDLGLSPGRDFEETLAKVSGIMGRRKESWIGLSGPLILQPLIGLLPFPSLSRLAGRALRRGEEHPERRPPVLTNIGPLDPVSLTFDEPPLQACFLPQLLSPPNIQVAVSGYDGGIHLVSGAYPSADRVEAAQALFRAMDDCLPSL